MKLNAASAQFEILSGKKEFASLEEEWEDLYQNSPLATPFQSWAWLYSWWEYYGNNYDLRLITVRNSESFLVGIIPLMLERRWGLGRLLFIGGDLVTPYKDILMRKGWENQVAEAGITALKEMTDWQIADFQEMRPTSAAWKLFQKWDGHQARVWKLNYLVIDVKPWNELLGLLSKKQRKNTKRTLRQAEAEGVHCKIVSTADIEQAAHRLVALHRELRQGRDIDPEHLTQRFEDLILRAAHRMTSRGFAELYEFWRDGEVLVSGFMVLGTEFDGAYIVGASQEAIQRYQWSSLARWHTVSAAYRRGSRILSLMDGDPRYKMRWASNTIPDYRVILGQRSVLWRFYAAYYILLSKVKRYVKSDATPQWVKSAAHEVRILRAKCIRIGTSEGRAKITGKGTSIFGSRLR